MVRLLKTAIMRLTLGSQPQASISSCRQNLSNPVKLFPGSKQWRGYPVITNTGLLHPNRLAFPCQEKRAISFSTSSRVWARTQQCLADEKDSGSLEHERSQKACGEIHLILGPMFAGKTTALLKSMDAEMKAGRKILLVKSDKDTRYGLTAVVSHDGMKMPCRAVSSLTKFKAELGEQYKETDVIGIDEAQFFKDLFSFCQEAADLDGKTVFVAGLDGDFLRRSFGSALDLIPLAESVTKLSARCEICQKPAAFTFRKTGDERTEVIGGADVYMPVCRQHYVSGHVALEAARTVLELHQPYQTSCGNGNLQL